MRIRSTPAGSPSIRRVDEASQKRYHGRVGSAAAKKEQAPWPWLRSAPVDSFFFSFGWLLALAAFVAIDQLGFGQAGRVWLIACIIGISFLHRHLTFPLVYGDAEQFGARRRSYLVLPLLIGLLLLIAALTPKRSELTVAPVAFVGSGRVHVDIATSELGEITAPRRVSIELRGETAPEALTAQLQPLLRTWFDVTEAGGQLSLVALDQDNPVYLRVSDAQPELGLAKALGFTPKRWETVKRRYPFYELLLVIVVIWTIYHSVMQKVGILRFYSRRAGLGNPSVDKGFVVSWLIFLILHLGSLSHVREQAVRVSRVGRLFVSWLEWADWLVPVALGIALGAALLYTSLYLREEWRNRERISWPRNLFAGSLLLLNATFYYDLIAGYLIYAFSHAIEYLAFVALHSSRKYLAKPERSSFMAWAVRRQPVSLLVYIALVGPVFALMRWKQADILHWYITGSGFLHFLYDGWIWKVRRPDVGKPMGLRYGSGTPGS